MNYQSLTDHKLVELLKSSDQKAFRALYDRYWKSLYIAAYYKLHSKEAAEEIVQNIFTSIWEKRHTHSIQQPEQYLRTALKYQVISAIKTNLAKEEFLHASSAQTISAEPFAAINLKDLQNALQQAINLLPPKTAEVFRLSRLEHYPVKQIATQLNISEKAVEYHITQSLKIMRTRLKDFMLLLFF